MRDITERKALEAQLTHQATHDPLTGLPNRTLLLDRLGQILARARRDSAPCAVLFLDLDRFKEINDTLGHAAGDQLLVAVAARLRARPREQDTLARLGGDEFVALLEGISEIGEASVCGGTTRGRHRPPPAARRSGGPRRRECWHRDQRPRPYRQAEELLRDADIAMYRAKAAGGDNYAIFDPDHAGGARRPRGAGA